MVEKLPPVARRSFLSRFGIGAAALGAGVAAVLPADAQTGNGFRAQRHPSDDWLDAPKGSHRLVIDSSTPEGGGAALLYAGNFFTANKNGYNLDPPSLAVVVVLRHFSTPFGYTDAIWAKYGAAFSELADVKDPKTNQAPTRNMFNVPDYGTMLPNFGVTLDSLIQRNVQFAICDMATHFVAGAIADKTKGNADAIYRELAGGLIPNAHMVAAGVVGATRAQERGYAFLYAG